MAFARRSALSIMGPAGVAGFFFGRECSGEATSSPLRLFELIVAANYMDIKSLLDLGCAKVATLIKGKSPEDIRRTFNIVNDFTPEEEARIREENRWCGEG